MAKMWEFVDPVAGGSNGSPKDDITNTLSGGDPSLGSTTIAPPSWVSPRRRALLSPGPVAPQ
jgi:hypothetical protein